MTMIENQTNLPISKKAQRIITIVRDMKGCDPQQFPRSRYYRYEVEFIDGSFFGSDSKTDIIEHIRGYKESDYAEVIANAERIEAEAVKTADQSTPAANEPAPIEITPSNDTNDQIIAEMTDETREGHHKRKYQLAVEQYGRAMLESLILSVWTPERLVEGFYEDENLGMLSGTIFELGAWDALANGYVSGKRIKANCPEIKASLASKICMLKACARGIVYKTQRIKHDRMLKGGE